MYSGILMAFSSLVFGFSVNFYMAIVFRYLTGLTNGKNIVMLEDCIIQVDKYLTIPFVNTFK